MFCSISGKPTENPVLSPVSGHIFDKELIETYVEQTGKDPINNQLLSQVDLIQVKQVDPIVATPNNLTSIPNLLSQFQKEWDALLIELFTLRKQLKESREELSILLYHQDAAVRVAAKAIAERDEAKKALEQLASSMAKGEYSDIVPNDDDNVSVNEVDDQEKQLSINEEISSEIMKVQSLLFDKHKTLKRKPPFSSVSVIKLTILETFDLQPYLADLIGFKTATITSIKPQPENSHILLISFDNDHAIVFDSKTREITQKLVAPKKKKLVSSEWLQELPILGFADGSIFVEDSIIKSDKKLLSLVVHPILPIIIAIHSSGFQFFHNRELIFESGTLSYDITCLALHGDGVLLSVGGKDGCIYIYDISTGQLASKLNEVGDGSVKSLKFASNGYSLICEFEITESTSNRLKIYDLRKQTVAFEIDGVNFLNIDYSSNLIYLLKETDAKIEISYLRYHKKQKTWKMYENEENLFVDQVTKLKKKQTTHVVCCYEAGENMVLVENTNILKQIQIVSSDS